MEYEKEMKSDVLLLTPFFRPNIGGAESFVESLCEEASRWFNLTVLTFQPFTGKAQKKEEYYYTKGSLKIYRMGWLIKPSRPWRGATLRNGLSVIPSMALYSFFMMWRRRYRIVHSMGLLSGLIGVMLKKIYKCKHYLTLLALYDFKEWKGPKRWLAKYILDNSDLIFVEGLNGQKETEWLSQQPTKIRVFTHWADQKVYRPDPQRPNDRIRILFIGRDIPEKGMSIVKAAERILDNPKYEFTYVTKAKPSDLPAIYRRHHILVVPSQYNEGHSRVVVEGACCGCAVITSDRGSLPEQVSGLGMTFEDITELYKKLDWIYWQRVWERMGKSSSEYAKNHFTSKNAEIFMREYD